MIAAFRTSSFTYNGDRLVYDDYGDGERLVVYLHGLLIDSEMNRGIARALAAGGNRVVLLDLLGHGRSDKPTHASEYRIDTYADQVFALLDELGVEEAVLGGMSLGANVSLFAASRQPRRVRGLVLEMPVLEWAVPPCAMFFAPLLLLVHYARRPVGWISSLVRMLPATPSDADQQSAPRGRAATRGDGGDPARRPRRSGRTHPGGAGPNRRAHARAGPPQRPHPPVRRRRQARRPSARTRSSCGRGRRSSCACGPIGSRTSSRRSSKTYGPHPPTMRSTHPARSSRRECENHHSTLGGNFLGAHCRSSSFTVAGADWSDGRGSSSTAAADVTDARLAIVSTTRSVWIC